MIQALLYLGSISATLTQAVIVGLVFIGFGTFVWNSVRPSSFQAQDKHVFITGGSSGLGLSIAKKYAALGAKISIIARNEETLRNAKSEIEAVQSRKNPIFTASCDVINFDAIKNTIENANDFHGRTTDHVICNAGVAEPGFILDQEVSTYRKMMDLNYFGVLHTVKAALPAMVKENVRGRIVIIASACSLVSFAGYTQYCASKYAVRGFAEALRNELLAHHIKVHIMYPGSIDTKGFRTENLSKPQVTIDIEGSSTLHHPDQVADSLLKGLKREEFAITNEWILNILRSLSNGISPRSNTALEILFMPLALLMQIGYLFHINSCVRKLQLAKPKKE